MRSFAVLSAIALLLFATTVSALTDRAKEFLLQEQFDSFKAKFGKSYSGSEEEEYRFGVFKETVERVALKNKEMDPVFGITKFADLTQHEFRERYLTYRPSGFDSSRSVKQPKESSVPSSFDWRDEGMVTAVKDQGYCGSCWAFSTTETVESAYAIAGNSLTELSVAQLVQCDTQDSGCNGGDPPLAYEYVESAGGLATEEDYPYSTSIYNGRTGKCSSDFTVAVGISGYEYATPGCFSRKCNSQDEDTLASNLATVQPASICVDASEWSDYTGGVMTSSSCNSGYYNLDHCVQLVGYSGYTGSASSSTDGYWLVRNSWASDWGEDGYIYLKMGDNTCGVATEATMVDL